MMKRKGGSAQQNQPLITAIRTLLDRKWDVSYRHVFHECNRVTDWLSNFGMFVPYGIHYLEDPPDRVRELVTKDKAGDNITRVYTL